MKAKMKAIVLAGVIGSVLSIQASAQEMFTGDVKLSCEAVLCLSSSQQPGACAPSLARYFGISAEKWSDTLQGRMDFLNLCPASHDQSANMPSLINDIANGAGRCDTDYLNRYLARQEMKTVCTGDWAGDCQNVQITVISNVKPAWCKNYESNALTDIQGAQYVGTPEEGGYWASNQAFAAEQAKWAAAQEAALEAQKANPSTKTVVQDYTEPLNNN